MSEVPLIPREVLFGSPERGQTRISPDGASFAFVAPWKDTPNLWIDDRSGQPARRLTDRTSGRIVRPAWAFDGRHVLFLDDAGGDENWHLLAIDVHDGSLRDLTPIPGVAADLIGLSPQLPDTVAVAINDRDPALHDAYRISLASGDRELAARNPGDVSAPAPHLPGAGWIADLDLRVRCRTRSLPDAAVGVEVRDAEDGTWRELCRWSLDDTRNSWVVGFSGAGDRIYLVDSSGSEAGRLVSVAVKGGGERVLLEDPAHDVDQVLTHPATGEPLIAGVLRDRAELVALDQRFSAAVAGLHHDGAPLLAGCDRDATTLLAYTEGDQRSPRFVVSDTATGATETVAETHPRLGGYVLAPMEVVSYPSSDGLQIPAYLTLPVGRDGPVPLVVFPHGGPWHRDFWGFVPEAQWLANRGYGCLQPNFRGSTGYGKTYLNAGNRQWARAILGDVVAGARWAVGEGIADPRRLAMFGGSFGGYMTLAAIAFEPDLFACAVDLFGWCDLVEALRSLPAYWGPRRDQWYRRVGHPDEDRDDLWAQSPLSRADQMRTPLLVAHGANDVRVPKRSSDQIVEAVRANGLECEYIVFEDEGHGFSRPENRLRFYAAAERFLARHLGGRAEP